jgi:predicted outer membrane lipoprotein
MTPKKKPAKPPHICPRCAGWDGRDRRKKAPFNWTPTLLGLLFAAAGVVLNAVFREGFDLVPIALIIVGGAMIDKEAIKVASKMFAIRRGNGNTEEHQSYGPRV